MAKQRLDRILAEMGVGSRRDIKKMARSGLIEVDGRVVRDPSLHIDPGEQVLCVAGQPVHYQRLHYWMMNKPPGVVSAVIDPRHRTVIDLLDESDRTPHLFPAGRLDIDTEGFVLITDDGQLAHAILSPKRHVSKTYRATVQGRISDADIAAFAQGLILRDGYRALPAHLQILNAGERSEVEIVLREGKFHQIKRMFAALGKPVLYLKRVAIGGVQLDPSLPPGGYRALADDEIARLRETDPRLPPRPAES
ncbi:pseudouridine synthase [Kyrpidia spormannii]|uniref:Uncharacterized RNA pseudouridine synthase YtzG n=1 Tax=Kyrpidia spormannii TaxID=2055160 RepID=A0ACA8ZBX4_9BACL|nr:pseudouridine synthase [Kyrpidia spormannii]CAB3393877.1 Uncharacterized RNA pseudouridine synthase YtzG [Kyrpidia spormannii]